MALTTSSASTFLQYLSGGQSGSLSYPSIYIALGWDDGTLSPNNAQGFKEISGAASYARALLGSNTSGGVKHMNTPTYDTSEGVEKTTNKDIIYFNEATEPWYPGGDSSHQVHSVVNRIRKHPDPGHQL